jgi:hypothetical protein
LGKLGQKSDHKNVNFCSLFLVQIQENTMLEGKIRALEDDRERLVKSLNNLQNAAEKSTKSAEIAKGNLSAKMAAFTALKKVKKKNMNSK